MLKIIVVVLFQNRYHEGRVTIPYFEVANDCSTSTFNRLDLSICPRKFVLTFVA
jgi:hypothetical protein